VSSYCDWIQQTWKVAGSSLMEKSDAPNGIYLKACPCNLMSEWNQAVAMSETMSTHAYCVWKARKSLYARINIKVSCRYGNQKLKDRMCRVNGCFSANCGMLRGGKPNENSFFLAFVIANYTCIIVSHYL